ncbi:MAG: hypothetical protein WC516_06100 [Patescibacteria group bacterium]|jgi:hypothetical protein
MPNEVITREQFEKLIKYLMDEKRDASFRYLIYNVMGFTIEDYSWLYSTGLMQFNNYIYELRNKGNKNGRLL